MINLENLDNQLANAVVLEEMDNATTTTPLWKCEHNVKVLDIVETKLKDDTTAYNIMFIDEDGNKMPDQFGGTEGAIFMTASRFPQFITSLRWCFNLDCIKYPKVSDVLKELVSNYHTFYFVIKGKMQTWGASQYNQIDFKKTAELNKVSGGEQ